VPEGEDLIYYRSGKSAEVSVVGSSEGLVLKVNNNAWQGGTQGLYLETRLGMLPLLLEGSSERALVMGLGTGNTLFGLLTAGAKEVDCVEIIPEVLTAQTAFHQFESRTPEGGTLRIIQGDARVILRFMEEPYDLILGDLYFPWQSEAGAKALQTTVSSSSGCLFTSFGGRISE
jgi:SAM-dependent methyltransferase